MNSQIGVSSVHVIVSRSEGKEYWKAGLNKLKQAHIRCVFNALNTRTLLRLRQPVSHYGRKRTPYSGLFQFGLHFFI